MLSTLLLSGWMAVAICHTPASAGVLRLENAALSVDVDDEDGAIVSVRNRRAGLQLITRPLAHRQPWLLQLDGNEFVGRSRGFEAARIVEPGRQVVELQWAADYDITVRMTLTLADDADQLARFEIQVEF